jgi:hypothetical protein
VRDLPATEGLTAAEDRHVAVQKLASASTTIGTDAHRAPDQLISAGQDSLSLLHSVGLAQRYRR